MSEIIDSAEMGQMLLELARQIKERHPAVEDLTLVGIQRRGVDIANRLARILGLNPAATGRLDINLYRDDWTRIKGGAPHIGSSSLPLSPENRIVLLIDDVLFSGRTARSAIEAILDYGRPEKIELLVFIDRGHRELPIAADYIGKTVPTTKEQQVDVFLEEHDGKDGVYLR